MHKHYVNEERKLVRNRGEVDAWYIENDHKAIVSESLWQKAQDAIGKKREYLATASVIEDFTEENYPYKNQLFCRLCGSRLVRHYNPKNKKVFWICNRNKRQGKESCTGVRVPDSVIRAWGSIKGDIYIEGKVDRNGKKRYSYSGTKPTKSE